jgi:hypothetical protein
MLRRILSSGFILRRIHAVCFLAILFLTVPVSMVQAAPSTSMQDLTYPSRVVLGDSAFKDGFPVTYTVSWTGASAGSSFYLSVYDADAGDYVDGKADMASCLPASSLGSKSAKAICDLENIAASGQLTAKLLVQLRSPKIYHLLARVTLFDINNQVVSTAYQSFSVEVVGGSTATTSTASLATTTTSTASLVTDESKTVQAESQTDYTMTYIIIGAIIAVVALVGILLMMRKRGSPKTATATPMLVQPAEVAAPAAEKFCMDCGAPLPVHAPFCSECGSKQ